MPSATVSSRFRSIGRRSSSGEPSMLTSFSRTARSFCERYHHHFIGAAGRCNGDLQPLPSFGRKQAMRCIAWPVFWPQASVRSLARALCPQTLSTTTCGSIPALWCLREAVGRNKLLGGTIHAEARNRGRFHSADPNPPRKRPASWKVHPPERNLPR